MPNAYAFIEDDRAIIGNDYIERQFSVKNGSLCTAKIINKRIKGEKELVFKPSSAEFYIGFREKKTIGSRTVFLSSNELELDTVNALNRRVEFIFKPYRYNGAFITFIMNVEIEDGCHYMHKNIEMMVAPEQQHLITIDYIDCEHIIFDKPEQQWSIGEVEKVFLEPYHQSLGQPFYINGMFFGSEFPMAENRIEDRMAFIRYYSGKRFDMLKLNCGHTFRTWNTVVGAARGLEQEVIRDDFFRYIRKIARDIKPRFQYNSWYDHMLDITNENITKSFREIEKNLSKTLVPPLHSYVVDDGFADYSKGFWCFNSKFPEELYPASSLANKFSSQFGLWLGPRGGYTGDTPKFGKNMEKAGTGGYNKKAKDVCVAHPKYIKNITEYFIENMDKFDINYWKLDGFLLRPCRNKKHGHIVGGYNGMYEYTETWENWIDVFRKIRLHRESAGKTLWINQTSYCNPSPWYLQWADSLWIQNSGDMGRFDRSDKGEKLGERDVDKLLSYRAERYYAFCVKDNFQFPIEYLYNHDPIYGNSADIKMTDEEYRNYMMMMTTRGTAFWELYYSYNMFSPAKWRINADALRFVRENYDTLRTARFIGTPPSKAGVYGFSSWRDGQGIVSLRNSANREQKFVLTLDKTIGTYANAANMRRAIVYPYTNKQDGNLYGCGDTITVTLPPLGTVIMKFSSVREKKPELLYGRFESASELRLYFDSRVYFDDDCVSSDCGISDITLLEDYSTVAVTFDKEVESAFVSMTVKNEFGDIAGAEFKGRCYPDFVCTDNRIPAPRDFTVSFKAEKDGSPFARLGNIAEIGASGGRALLRFGDKTSSGSAQLVSGDRLIAVCEPNGLLKLYVNGELDCSVYNEDCLSGFENAEVTLSESASELKVLSKALSYDEV